MPNIRPNYEDWINHVATKKHIHCKHLHSYSCETNGLRKFWVVFSSVYKFYVPIHVLPVLIWKRNRLTREPLKILKNCIKNILQSCLFISTYVALLWYFMCKFRNWRYTTDKWNVIYAAIICNLGLLWEPAGRRTELALYMFPRLLESCYLFLDRAGYLKWITKMADGEVIVFSIALGMIMYFYQNEERNIRSTYLNMFKSYWGKN